jgi:hypothetical protein
MGGIKVSGVAPDSHEKDRFNICHCEAREGYRVDGVEALWQSYRIHAIEQVSVRFLRPDIIGTLNDIN